MSELSLVLKGLNCPNCAGKIERNVKKIKNVSEANLNLMNQEILIEYNGISKENLIDEVTKITLSLEPDVIVKEKTSDFIQNIPAGHCTSEEHGHIHGECCSHEHGDPAHASPEQAYGNEKIKREMPKGLKGFLLSHMDAGMKKRVGIYAVGFAFYILGMTKALLPQYSDAFLLTAYGFFGYSVITLAFKNILKGEVFDENFLMTVATLGAIFIGDYKEAVAVMIFYQIGEFFQDLAVERSRASIKSLMNLKADYANIISDDKIKQVDPRSVAIGDIILVKPGEKVPLDGIVINGKSQIDASSLIGESVPQSIYENDTVMSGCVNLTGALKIQVTKDYSNSTIAKIMEMVEKASSRKASTEKFITKFSRIYTPAVVLAALLLAIIPPLIIPGAVFSDWIYRALIFLVVSCPCALVISVPLSFFSGIGFASKKGILVKGSTYLEELTKLDTIVFDKTGTLTKGVFTVTNIFPEEGYTEKDLLTSAYSIEKYSNHPIAKSILTEVSNRALDKDIKAASEFEEIAGHGVKGLNDGALTLAGNAKLMEMYNVEYKKYDGFGTILHIAAENKYMGFIVISDIVKDDSKEAIKRLKALGIERTVMLTGDKKETAEIIGKELGLDFVYSELLPDGKVEVMETLYSKYPNAKIAFSGDGINDAPVLARADVGIAMGGIGSDAAIEAADVVIMTDEPSKIADLIQTAKKTMAIVKQNISLALIIKFAVLILSVFNFASMWHAVFADVGVTLIAVINAMRAK